MRRLAVGLREGLRRRAHWVHHIDRGALLVQVRELDGPGRLGRRGTERPGGMGVPGSMLISTFLL
jgi:hypothetical protein